MTKILVYLLLFGAILYVLSSMGKKAQPPQGGEAKPPKFGRRFRGKRNPRELWVQVYETASMDEGRMLQARLEEEEVECILYEQGKKDIHGNSLKGIGVAVPKTAAPHAQNVISRMPT